MRRRIKGQSKLIIYLLSIIVVTILSFIGIEYGTTETVGNTMPINIVKPENLQNITIKTGSTITKDFLSETKQNLKVYFFDVGQADSILIMNEEQTMLIDAGNNDDGEMLVKNLETLGITKIDYLVGTHPHEDHIGGAPTVFENCEVKTVIMPDATTNTRIFTQTLDAIEKENCQNHIAEPGDVYAVGDTAKMTILGPIQTPKNNLNNCSIILRFVYGHTAFVFTGDAEEKAEKQMLDAFADQSLACDLYQVGHHGSSTSSSLALLEALKPTFAVLSCGKDNDYGHPHNEIIKRLSGQGIKYYRTDEDGSIVFSSDGNIVSLISKIGA